MKIAKHLIPNVGTLVIIGLLLLAQSVGALPATAPAEPLAPSQTVISYQGTLTDSYGNPISGPVSMEFALYDGATGGNLLWGPETQTVQVEGGLFHALLGSVTPINSTTLAGDLYLNIKVGGEPMTPRERLSSVIDAVNARSAQGDFMMNGHDIIDAFVITYQDNQIRLAGGDPPSLRLISENDVLIFLDSDNNATNRSLKIYRDNGAVGAPATNIFEIQEDGRVEVRGSLDMNGNSAVNCGALTEANLQTRDELAADGIDRFDEGDVLCWAGDRLEKCDMANDPLVQAVADVEGRPIVIGAEVIKVIGPIKQGDFLVASEVPGLAMATEEPAFGTVIAQALEDFEGDQGIIKAMIRKF